MGLFDLDGRVAVMTGASKGMGLAMAGALAQHGARVVVSSRKLEQCEGACEEINAKIGEKRALPFSCNIGYKEQLQSLVDFTHEALGAIDILVANAGVNPFYGPSSEIPDSAFDKIMASNVKSNHWLCHMVLPDMVAKKKGAIMITSSTAAFGPSEVLGTYNISKTADLALVRNLALEYGKRGVRVNAICPGLIRTDFARALWDNPAAEADFNRRNPLGRIGEPQELAGVAVFLASDASSYITGQALTVCGGSVMCR